MMRIYMKKTAYAGVLVALALIFSYIETFIPLPIPFPGIKLGLANIVIVYALFRMDIYYAAFISVVRVLVAGVLFGNMSMILYSLAGATMALIVMYAAKKNFELHVITISLLGALAHIIGQMIVAGMVTSFGAISYYAPVLLIFSVFTGIIIGLISDQLLKRIPIDID